jgi:hypothetical protein
MRVPGKKKNHKWLDIWDCGLKNANSKNVENSAIYGNRLGAIYCYPNTYVIENQFLTNFSKRV